VERKYTHIWLFCRYNRALWSFVWVQFLCVRALERWHSSSGKEIYTYVTYIWQKSPVVACGVEK